MAIAISNQIKTHLKLFIGLSGIPFLIHLVIILALALFGILGHKSGTAASYMTLNEVLVFLLVAPILPIFVGLTGFLLFEIIVLILDLDARLVNRPRTNLYLAVFTIAWNIVFIPFSFFVFAMGLGDHAQYITPSEFFLLLGRVLFQMFPLTVVPTSIAISAGVTALVIACTEPIAWIIDKTRTKRP